MSRWTIAPSRSHSTLLGVCTLKAPIILMSQNRQSEKDRLSEEHDYEVNLKAELEIMLLHEKIDSLRDTQWQELLDLQNEQLKLLGAMMPKTLHPPRP